MRNLRIVLTSLIVVLLATLLSSCNDKENSYDINFESLNHGAIIPNSNDETEISYLPYLVDSSYDFKGWFYDKDFKNEAYVGDVLTSNVSLYACWSKSVRSASSILDINSNMETYIDSLINETVGAVPSWNKESYKGKWNYIDGVFLNSIVNLYYRYKDSNITKANLYKTFFLNYIDYYLDSNGNFLNLKNSSSNGYTVGELDSVCESKILFDAYEMTSEEKYLNAIEKTIDYLESQPKAFGTNNYSHKTIYSNQIWLDGLYMYAPFYSRYAYSTSNSGILSTIKGQYEYIRNNMYNEDTNLYYHGLDTTKSIFWANKETGTSSSYWLRSMGWFIVSLVDVIEYFDGEEATYLQVLLKEALDGVLKYIDKDTNMFYQLVDLGDSSVRVSKNYLESLYNTRYRIDGQYYDTYISNYLESSGSSMISYALIKGAKRWYLSDDYRIIGEDIFEGIYAHSYYNGALNDICITAGLGPEDRTYRDGSSAYYLAEMSGSNDAKGVGPFIMAYLEYSNSSNVIIPTPNLK